MPDVVVVGGGIIGCAVAERLSRNGLNVHVVDPRPVAGGATQASGGMLTPHFEGVHSHALEALGARSLALYDEFLERARAAGGPSPPYERTGSLHVAFDESEAAELECLAAAHKAGGIDSRLLGADEARHLEPGLAADCTRALFVPVHGFVGAPALARLLADAAVQHGTRWSNTTARRIAPGAHGSLDIETDAGRIVAPHVVLAAGSWTPQLEVAGVVALPVRPVRGQLLWLRGLRRPLSRIVWGPRSYLVPWPDGTLLVGATSEDVGYDERATVTGVRDLLDAAAEMVPSVWHAEFLGVRVGLRPAAPDELPIIGASARVPGLVYATGHYRNGVLLAPLTAELVAKAVAGDHDPAFATTSPARFGDF